MRNPHQPVTHTLLPALRKTEYSFAELVGSLKEFVTSLRDQAQKAASPAGANDATKAALKDAQSLLDAMESLTKVLREDRLFDLLVAVHAVSRLTRNGILAPEQMEDLIKREQRKSAEHMREVAATQNEEEMQALLRSCEEVWKRNSTSRSSAKHTADEIDPGNKDEKNSSLEKKVRNLMRARGML
jgi:hypothetical protein